MQVYVLSGRDAMGGGYTLGVYDTKQDAEAALVRTVVATAYYQGFAITQITRGAWVLDPYAAAHWQYTRTGVEW